MPHFFSKHRKKFSINFSEIESQALSEIPFWEVQRNEVLRVLTTFYSSWQDLWTTTKRTLDPIYLSDEDLHHLEFYESEQQKTVIKLLADALVAWEKDDQTAFSATIFNLAHELRPSLMHFETSTAESFSLSPSQTINLKEYTKSEAASLKSTIAELQRLAWRKFEFGDKVLSPSLAEALIKERLGISNFEFLDFSAEPQFNTRGFLPALLQESADFDL